MEEFKEYFKDALVEEKKATLIQNTRYLARLQKKMMPQKERSLDVKAKPVTFFSDSKMAKPNESYSLPSDEQDFLIFCTNFFKIPIDENFTAALHTFLDPNDYRYANYMARLKLKLYESLIVTSNIYFEDSRVNMSDALHSCEEISSILEAIEQSEYERELTKEETETLKGEDASQENELFFIESNRKVFFLESLDKQIPVEMYGYVKRLLEQMRQGHFYDLKVLTLASPFPILQVRYQKTRVVFIRMGRNKYLIIDVFVKKDFNSKYNDQLYNYVFLTSSVKDYYMSLINDQDTIKKHDGYYNDIIAFCDSKKRGI